jgi:hypothetical protein
MAVEYASRIRELIPDSLLPSELSDFFQSADGTFSEILDSLYFTDYSASVSSLGFSLIIDLLIPEELAISLPGLDSLQIVIGSTSVGTTSVTVSFFVSEDDFEFRLDNVALALRFPPSILKPVATDPDSPQSQFVQIETNGSIVVDRNYELKLEGFSGLSLTPAMVGDSGIIISAQELKLDLSRTSSLPEITSAGFDESFLGIYIGEATVQLPEGLPAIAPEDLVLRNCALGSGGISGRLEIHYSSAFDSTNQRFTGPGSGDFFGIPFGMRDIDEEPAVLFDFRENSLRESRVNGQILLPFFDKPLEIEIGITLNGSFLARLGGASGLCTLIVNNILEIELDSIGFEVKDSLFITKVSGQLTPLFGQDAGLEWPSFDIKELSIDSQGNVKFDGGWLDLEQGYSLDLYGFQMEITKLGFGKSDDGGKWVGFSGSLKLVDGLSAGASVEGLRITWYEDGRDPQISLNGAGVELLIPDTLYFKGEIAFRQSFEDGKQINRFDGGLTISLLCLGLEIDGQVVFGVANNDPFMAVYLGIELPAGIPLGQTGIALYGMAGLGALQMEPDKKPEEEWYSLDHKDWFHRGEVGVSDLKKWQYRSGAFALGAGVTLGTLADNGFTFSGKMLLVIVIPGPVILLEGRANLLTERSKLSDEPVFHSLAVLDARVGELLFGLDARFAYDDTGSIIEIAGSSKAYFNFNNPESWYLYIGKKDPITQRIRADIFNIFKANSWFMIDPQHGLDTGTWAGWYWHGNFEIVEIIINAWIEGGAKLSFNPLHFHGELKASGSLAVNVLGFGFGLELKAHLEADVDHPLRLFVRLFFMLDLPWPFDDIQVDFSVYLGQTDIDLPTLPEPLQEVAIEHFKSTASWPLYLHNQLVSPDSTFPIVPVDARPHITFTRPVHDDTPLGIGWGKPNYPNNPLGYQDYEPIGDPRKDDNLVYARYSLEAIALYEWDGRVWQEVASSSSSETQKLYGSWAPVPQLTDSSPSNQPTANIENTKLWLLSKNPFDYTRRTLRTWDEWLVENFEHYPCPQEPNSEDLDVAYDFMCIKPRTEIKFEGAWPHPLNSELLLLPMPSFQIHRFDLATVVDGMNMAYCPQTELANQDYACGFWWKKDQRLSSNRGIALIIYFSTKPSSSSKRSILVRWCENLNSPVLSSKEILPNTGLVRIEINEKNIYSLEIRSSGRFCLYKITFKGVNAQVIEEEYQRSKRHLQESLERWTEQAFVFKPNRAGLYHRFGHRGG